MTDEYESKYQLACDVLKGLCDRLKPVMEEEIKSFCDKADRFYASAQSRDAKASARFRAASYDECSARCDLTTRAYLYEQDEFTKACYQHALEFFRPRGFMSVSQCYSYLRWAYAQTPELKNSRDFWSRTSLALSSLEQMNGEWSAAIKNAICGNWKPIYILSGDYGDYDTCIGYDEEFGVFLSFSPDDNYYHWRDYHIGVISQKDAEERLKLVLTGLPSAPASPHFHSYFSSSADIEVLYRIK